MRYHEILEAASAIRITEAVEAGHLPTQYDVDPVTGLAVNTPGQWSQSPYLGAVKSANRQGYLAQINIPQQIWRELIQQDPHKWSGKLPDAYFNDQQQDRPPIRVGFQDPRQAAWLMQNVLYGGDAKDLIEDYLEKYLGGPGDLWNDIVSRVPDFDGEPMTKEDEPEFRANPEEFERKREERKKAAHAARTQASNTESYEPTMKRKIVKSLVDFYSKNDQLLRKRLGRKFANVQELQSAMADFVDSKGVEYFTTTPGGVNLKDVASLPLK